MALSSASPCDFTNGFLALCGALSWFPGEGPRPQEKAQLCPVSLPALSLETDLHIHIRDTVLTAELCSRHA